MRKLPLFAVILLLADCAPRGRNGGGALFIEIKNAPLAAMDPQLEQQSEAMHRYLLGQLAVTHQDFPDALKNLSEASKLTNAASPSLHGQLAELNVREGKLTEALAEVNKALEAAPADERYLLLAAGVNEALNRFAEAEELYQRVIAAWPDNLEAHVLLSGLYTKQRDFTRAIEVLKKLTAKPAFEAMGRYYLGHVYELKGDAAAAESEYLKAYAQREPSQASNVIADVLRLYLTRNETKKAQEFCRRVLRQDPGNVVARRVLSQLLMGQKRFDEALQQLRVLTTLETNPEEARFKIALIQIEKQNYKEAEQELLLVLAKKPDLAEARYYLGSTYAATGRDDEAVVELLKVEGKQDVVERSRTFAAFLLRRRGDLPGARRAIEAALHKDPDNKKLALYLVLILRDMDDYEEAQRLLEAQMRKHPQDAELRFQYGVLLSDAGRGEEALQAMQRALELDPRHSDAMNFIAYSYAEEGVHLDEALRLVEEALKIKPKDGYYIDTLAWVYYRMGRISDAKREIRRAVKIVKDDVVVMEHLGDVLLSSGNKESAVKAYSKALKLGLQSRGGKEERQAVQRLKEKLKEHGVDPESVSLSSGAGKSPAQETPRTIEGGA